MPLQTPYDQLRETARSFGIDPAKYGPNDGEKLKADVIQVRAGGAIPDGKGIDIPDPPAMAGPPAQQPPPPPQQPPPQQPPHPANNQQGRAMNQAHAVVFNPPGVPDPYGNIASNQYALDKTERYIAAENRSRVDQAKDEAERQHEREMEMLKQRGLIDRLGSMQSQGQVPQKTGPMRMWDSKNKTWKYGSQVQIGGGGAQIY